MAKARPRLVTIAYGVPFERALSDALAWGGQEVFRKVISRVGEAPVDEIGHGGHGVAYRLPSGRVLKTTVDWTELDAMSKLRDVPHPNVVGVHDVFTVDVGQGAALGIVVRDAVDATLQEFDPEAAGVLDGLVEASEDILEQRIHQYGDREKALRRTMADLAEELDLEARRIGAPQLADISEAISHLSKAGIRGISFRSRNVGVSGPDRRGVIFDFGRLSRPRMPVVLLGPSLGGRKKSEAELFIDKWNKEVTEAMTKIGDYIESHGGPNVFSDAELSSDDPPSWFMYIGQPSGAWQPSLMVELTFMPSDDERLYLPFLTVTTDEGEEMLQEQLLKNDIRLDDVKAVKEALEKAVGFSEALEWNIMGWYGYPEAPNVTAPGRIIWSIQRIEPEGAKHRSVHLNEEDAKRDAGTSLAISADRLRKLANAGGAQKAAPNLAAADVAARMAAVDVYSFLEHGDVWRAYRKWIEFEDFWNSEADEQLGDIVGSIRVSPAPWEVVRS